MTKNTNDANTAATGSKPRYTSSRDWMVTLFPDGEDFAAAEQVFIDTFEAGVYQIEEGKETGKKHLQGFGQFVEPRRFSTVVKALSADGVKAPHIEMRRTSVAKCVTYVTKDDTRIGEPVFFGDINYRNRQGARNDLVELREQILSGKSVDEVLLDDDEGKAARCPRYLQDLNAAYYRTKFGSTMRDVNVIVVTGPPGVGKTQWAFNIYGKSMNRVTEYGRDPFGAYDPSRKALVLEDYTGQLDIELLLSICDRYPAELPARYHNKQMTHETVVILSNLSVHEWYKSAPEEQRQALKRRIHAKYGMTADHELVILP